MKMKTLFISILATLTLGLGACNAKDAPKPSDPGTSEPGTSEPADPGTSEPSEPGTSEPEEPHVHSYGEWTVVTQPTCTEKGKQERVCECGEKEEQDIDALGHLPGDWEVVLEPTVDAEGQKVKKCQRCHEVLETESIDKLTPPEPTVNPIVITDAALMGYAGTNMTYGDGNGTIGEVKFNYIECGAYGNGIQMRTKNGKSSTIWNKDALPGALKQIKITLNDGKQVYANEHALTFHFGATAELGTSITWDTVADQKVYTIDVEAEGAVYFKLVHSITYSLYVDSIELIF